jgi:hypothetical protein
MTRIKRILKVSDRAGKTSSGRVAESRGLEEFRMNTVIFLIFVGVCAFVAVWLTRRPGKNEDLAKPTSEKLTPTTQSRLSDKEEVWEARRKFAEKELASFQRFVPKSEAEERSGYDGYSRRDRHHLTSKARAKEKLHAEKSN